MVCVSRLVPRKGQDTLIRALPRILAEVPDAVLLIVGGGPYRADAGKLRAEPGSPDSVRFTGPVPWEELPAHYGAGDVFAMPCRTRRGGLDVEGLGIVYLEASATGLPVVAGDSGGAPDAVLDGETGCVVHGAARSAAAQIADALDPGLLREPGRGRAWVERSGLGPAGGSSAEWRWRLQEPVRRRWSPPHGAAAAAQDARRRRGSGVERLDLARRSPSPPRSASASATA